MRLAITLLPLAAATAVSAAEIHGRVVAVEADSVRIAVEGSWLPVPGDPVTVHFEIPGVSKVRVGSWRVARVEAGTVVATLVEATGRPAVDQLATVASANPVPRATAAAVPAPSRPGFLGARVANAGGYARIDRVAPGGPADLAGLKEGDVVMAVDGTALASPEALAGVVGAKGSGARVVLRVNRWAELTDVPTVLGDPPAFPDVPEPPAPYDSSVGWSTLVKGPARVEHDGRVYETVYTKQVKSGVAHAIELFYFATPPKGKTPAVVNGQQLQNRFLREPAADHPDQSFLQWHLYLYEYTKGEWAFRDKAKQKVKVLSQPGL